jgi:hypothetical protein
VEHPVLLAIGRAGFTAFGWFAPDTGDGLPHSVRQVILIGNAGPAMFRRFAQECDGATGELDAWTRKAVGKLALELDATAVFPFDQPYPPILRWARKAGAGHVSPLGLNIHPTYGLWHAYRAALLFAAAFDLPEIVAGPHPCLSCAARPCLSTCPVSAFSEAGYDMPACVAHLRSAHGADCMSGGCLARHACPVGQSYAYGPEQARFHMRAFLEARRREGH